jgi:hypothetical protein
MLILTYTNKFELVVKEFFDLDVFLCGAVFIVCWL